MSVPRFDQASDREARRRACTVFDRPFVLEAGAGTGKTTALVARTLAWLLGPGWERASADAAAAAAVGTAVDAAAIARRALSGLVAITFTEAATAEMAGGIARALAQVARGECPLGFAAEDAPHAAPGGRERAAALLGALDSLRVSTIHAFCRRLLADHPCEAGLHPLFAIDAENEATHALALELLEEGLRARYAEDDPALATLAAKGCGPREVATALDDLITAGTTAAELAVDPLAAAKIAALLGRCREVFGGLAELLIPGAGGWGRADLARRLALTCAGLAASAEAAPDRAALAALAERAATMPDSEAKRLLEWRQGEWKAAERSALGDRTLGIAARAGEAAAWLATLARLDPELLAAGRTVLAPLLAELEERKRRQGLASYADLLRHAAALLRDEPAVRRRLRGELRQILVDEFQDTDPLQCELLHWLALDGPPEERPGLFVVGDPKQSIYGWRAADLAAYDEFVERLLAGGGEKAALVVSFRSVPAVLDEVERALQPLLRSEVGVQAAWTPLLPCAQLADQTGCRLAGRAPVEHWVSWETTGDPPAAAPPSARRAAELEARAIAADLVDLEETAKREGDADFAWSEVGLLFRAAGDQEIYLDELRRHGIPFRVEGDRHYYQRREVIDATALVRAVLDPGDQLALVALLRSPWVGAPDAALIPLWGEELPRLLLDLRGPDAGRLAVLRERVDRVVAGLDEDEIPGLARVRGWERCLLAAIESIARLRADFPRLAADRWVAELRRAFPLEALAAARFLGAHRLANLERLWRRLVTTLEEADGAVHVVLRSLREAVRDEREERSGAPPTRADAVRVMTIHGAKGLDFTHVYLPQLHRSTAARSRQQAFCSLTGGTDPQYVLFGAPTLQEADARRRAERVAAAESVRLLYVAMTRAKQRLVLLGNWPAAGERGPGAASGLLALLQESRGRERPAPSPEPIPSADGALLWRYPALEPLAAARPRLAPSPGALLPDPGTRVGEIAARRAIALARSARELVTRVTADTELQELVPPAPSGREVASRAVALAVGRAIHRFFELCDPLAARRAEVARLGAALDLALGEALPRTALPAARRAFAALLDGLGAGGELLGRLRAVAASIVARELPLVLAAPSAGEVGPIGATVGTLDLLYLDPANGEPVVADYKSDPIADGTALAARADHYAPQLRAYGRAVERSLALARPPRLELWFLAADRVVPVAFAPSAAPASVPAAD